MSDAANKRLADLRAEMSEHGADLLALGPGNHMHWLLGFHPHADERPCLLLVNAGGETFLMPAINVEESREHTDITMHAWDDADGADAALDAALDEIGAGGAKSAVLDETMRADFALLLLDRLPRAAHQFTDATLGALRMRKDDAEFAKLKENALINDRAMQAAFAAAKPGVSKLEIAAAIRATTRARAPNRNSPLSGPARTAPSPITIRAAASCSMATPSSSISAAARMVIRAT